MNQFMEMAVQEAMEGVKNNDGSPFGAVVVKNGQMVGKAHNEVNKTLDPTAHAEVLAIRNAASQLQNANLSGCDIYCSTEPCSLALAAIDWAKMNKIYYGCSREDAAQAGYVDKLDNQLLNQMVNALPVQTSQIDQQACMKTLQYPPKNV